MQQLRPYVLAETNWKTVKNTNYEVAILPWGATEAHNYHLPYATDNFQSEHIAIGSAKIAWENGNKVIVLPTIPFGVNTGQHDITLDINMNPSTQAAILDDVIASLQRHGIHKFVVLNGHGGNEFKQILRELQLKYQDVFLCQLHWFKMNEVNDVFDNPGDHAGEMETSLIMHLKPHLVLDLEVAGDGRARPFKIEAFQEQWAWAQREWREVTADTGVGNPHNATAEKGEKIFTHLTKRIGTFLTNLANADLNDMYE